MRSWQILSTSLLLFFIITLCYPQETITVYGKVIDFENSEPLIAATISVPDTRIGTICDEKGKFILVIPDALQKISISYIGYESKNLSIKELKRNTTILLKRSSTNIDEITILASPPIIPLTKRIESVIDFSIEEERILLLSKHKKGGHLLKLTDYHGVLLDSFSLEGFRNIEKLTTSCLETHFLLTEYKAHQIDLSKNKISIAHTDKRKRFDQYIANCLDANSNYFYMNSKKKYNQVSDLTGHHRYFDETVNFGQVSDDFYAKNYKEEKKYLDFMDNKGEDKWIHQTDYENLQNFYHFWEKAALIKYNFYLPVDFHLHAKENCVFVLDHEQHMLRKFTLSGEVVYQVPIQYSKNKKWSGKIFKDSKTEKIYTYFNYSSRKLLYEIDLSKGLLIPKAEFDLTFIDNFQVYDDTIFFTNSGLIQGQEARILKRIDFGF